MEFLAIYLFDAREFSLVLKNFKNLPRLIRKILTFLIQIMRRHPPI